MPYRPHGKARVDPESPSAFAICQRCGSLYNRYALNWQYQWQGAKLMNRRLQVCSTCMDKPSAFLRQIIIPADPPPVSQPRTEPYAIDEAGSWVPHPATNHVIDQLGNFWIDELGNKMVG